MADRLTQLQDCLDDLLTQMYASFSYIQTRHPYGEIPGQPSQAPPPSSTAVVVAEPKSTGALPNGDPQNLPPEEQKEEPALTPAPEKPDVFDAALRELARDLVLKEQQIEYLINSLPGIGSSEADQERRMRVLEAELRVVEKERMDAEREKEAVVEGLGRVIVGAKRVL